MLALTLCLAALSATPEKPPLRFGLPTVTVNGMDRSLAEPFTEHLAHRLVRLGVLVTSSQGIAAVLGFEMQKKLLGCGEADAACLSEIAGALDVDAIVLGSVVRTGDVYRIQLKVTAVPSSTTLASASHSARNKEEVFSVLEEGAKEIAFRTAEVLGRQLRVDTEALALEAAEERRGRMRSLSMPTGIAGAVLVVAGAVGVGLSRQDFARLSGPVQPLSLREGAQLRDRGATLQSVGWAGVGLGAAALVTAGTLSVLGAKPTPAVVPSVSVGPQGFGLTLGGLLP